ETLMPSLRPHPIRAVAIAPPNGCSACSRLVSANLNRIPWALSRRSKRLKKKTPSTYSRGRSEAYQKVRSVFCPSIFSRHRCHHEQRPLTDRTTARTDPLQASQRRVDRGRTSSEISSLRRSNVTGIALGLERPRPRASVAGREFGPERMLSGRYASQKNAPEC